MDRTIDSNKDLRHFSEFYVLVIIFNSRNKEFIKKTSKEAIVGRARL